MAKRTHICIVCGEEYHPRRESSRFCSKKCFGLSNIKSPDPCVVDGCGEVCDTHRGGRHGMCAKHAMRVERHGSPLGAQAPRRALKKGTYRSIRQPDHPLAGAGGRVAVHRMVLFDKIGPGSHPCHWCGCVVEWAQGSLVVDHVDRDTHNNSPDNLVPACNRCNTQRDGHPNASKTHCPSGHEYTPENTKWYRGWRYCRACGK